MMTGAWNEGLQRRLAGKLESATLCLRAAIRILRALPTLRPAYERKMLANFRNLLPSGSFEEGAFD